MKKTIHYCWFGGEMPPLVVSCIDSWKELCPDYELKKWSEDNFDIKGNDYVYQAYKLGKYAFVSDYVRLKALYEYGGIYLDTDVELLKSLDEFVELDCFFGFEGGELVSTGIFGAKKSNAFIYSQLKTYDTRQFCDENGNFDATTNVAMMTRALKLRGLKNDTGKIQNIDGISVYPKEYFGPKDHISGRIMIGPKTAAIHHYSGSWLSDKQKIKQKVLHLVGERLAYTIINLKKSIREIFR